MIKQSSSLDQKPLFDKKISMVVPELCTIEEVQQELRDIFSTGMLSNAKFVRYFEDKCREYIDVKHAVAVSSCTSGLMLLEKLLGLKGKVLCPTFTFVATVHSLIWNGLEPVFVDCDKETFNIDPVEVEKNIDSETCAILAVSVFGNPPAIDQLGEIATRHNLKLIFDSAHAFGGTYKGIRSGNFGAGEVFSLSPTKVLVAGEGGLVTTNDSDLAKLLRMGRNYGDPGNYDCLFTGLSCRMPEMNAVLGLKTLEKVDRVVTKRNKVAQLYAHHLRNIPGITLQKITEESLSTFKDFALVINEDKFGVSRNLLAEVLDRNNVDTRKYFSPLVHKQVSYERFKEKYQNKLTNSDYLSRNILCLPIYSHMTEGVVSGICDIIRYVHKNSDAITESFMANSER